ncbi:hypothetical protein GGI25_004238 [Coemansia spiralis]|uniref:Periplasmic binding protein n=2 Tax=Coemansia TaxID=4863 RepID=A0A9W8KXD0_9FUNG|nr:hypothetical protein EDC05_001521 [Coemansia umbellata]KAJ2624410.1 hypothetical protein GGI26_001545 [Coemansia sp. RSA 1358]KAJ2674775.1 hypothetical protein GGI25_004238 [Coemansia spiralis]
MKLLSLSSLGIAAVSVYAASTNTTVSTAGLQSTACVSSSDNSNLYTTVSEVKHAQLFSIDYHNTYKIVNNLSTNSTYVLYQCGSTKPSINNASAFIEIPVKDSAAWSTSAAVFIETLGVQNTLRNLGTAPSMVSACLQALLQNIIDPFNESNSTATDEQEDANDVVFNMPGGEDTNTTNTVYSVEYLESSALGRAEWVKFFAAFFNAEERANKLFGAIESNYNCYAAKADQEYNDIRPVIAWTSYAAPTEYNNNTAYWQISYADYKYVIVRDAGARMLNTTGPQATIFNTAQSFLDALEDVDILIDESFVSYDYNTLLKNYGITDPSKLDYSWLTTSRVFRPDRIQSTSGGLGWFEEPIIFADALLEDLIGVAHPKFVQDGYTPIWFRNLAKNETVVVLTASNCTDIYAQLPDSAQQCSSLDFQSANPSDADYSGVEVNQTQDLIYDLSDSEVINGSDNEGGSHTDSSTHSSSSDAPASLFAQSKASAVAMVAALAALLFMAN